MKISEALKQSSVTYYPKPKEPNPICTNCNRLKIKHSRDQTENCIRAIYFKV